MPVHQRITRRERLRLVCVMQQAPRLAAHFRSGPAAAATMAAARRPPQLGQRRERAPASATSYHIYV